VAFDIDANGILQITALDRTTGREQSITIQGASTLSEAEIAKAMRDAEEYADIDRERKERVEKRTRAESLTVEAERYLKEVALDFGMQFARSYRQRIESLIRELRDHLKQNDDRGIDQTNADLQDALYELKREVREYYSEDEDDDLFGSIRRIFTGDDEDELPRREAIGDRDYYGREARTPYYDERPSRKRPTYQGNWDDEDDNWL
jgi:molecular chaperone DnaK